MKKLTDKQREILKYIIKTDNQIIFHTYQQHGKEIYEYSEEEGWKPNVTDEKLVNMLFDMVKNLALYNKSIVDMIVNNEMIKTNPIIINLPDGIPKGLGI